ncbi:hypothetical protein [Leifsonia sp. TF02-11]|uniref:hypothetical protein n=1 Tax=Leifsonia sp. TF02-11 TaxID=2815212 RepID=UPI001AA0FBEC|nr:hypothetical protein [Leifsonia sp. TF02-11]MBO1740751.1 hypothetical protein [Leifsonia sp. TF02-11]
MTRLPLLSALAAAIAITAILGGAQSAAADAATTIGAAPANASTIQAPQANDDGPVTGMPWSAPAFPVDCFNASGQISCTPQNPADVHEQECFIGVPFHGSTAMVCTTYQGHEDALRAVGGRAATVSYGCSIGDLVCTTFENFGRGMALGATAAGYAMASSISFNTDSTLWSAAVGEWSFWQWAVLVVLFGAMVWSIAAAVVSRDREQLVSAIVRSFIAVPAVPLSLWTIGNLVNALDGMTWYILNRDGPGSLFITLQKVMWAGGQANYFFAFLIDGLLLLGMLLLVLVFMFRNLSLAVLIAVGPVAWMLFPVRSIGSQWVIRYVSAVVALLLTGPLTIGFLALIVDGLAGVKTIWDPRSWPLLLGLVMVSFAPFAVFSLFSFIGGAAVDSVGSRIGAGGARGANSMARGLTRMPSRVSSHPAGRPVSGGGSGGGQSAPPTRVASAPASRPSPQPKPATPAPATSTPRRS